MKDQSKTKEQLMDELSKLRQRNAELEKSKAEWNKIRKKQRESDAQLKSIVELSTDGYLSVNLKGMITDCNSAFLNHTGYSREDIVNKHFSKLPTLRVKDIPQFMKMSYAAIRGKVQRHIEYKWIHKDGSTHWGEVYVGFLKKRGIISGYHITTKDITERKQAADKIKASLKEKEVLLKEIHHRVKNNLQVISSLLKLQSEYIKDKKSLQKFKESQDRVRSMALIHEKLYQSGDFASISFKDYIKDLVHRLFRSYEADSGKIALRMDLKDVLLGIDIAIPCGLILNELLSNSLKHAFPENREGKINVGLRSVEKNEIELKVSDNGVGLPEDIDFRKTETLGLHLVTILGEDQLGGKIELKRTGGTEFKIRFKIKK